MIYLFLADGFEETEALATLDILRRANTQTKTVGISGAQVTGAHGIIVKADITADQAVTEGLEMIVLPGGPGYAHLEKSPVVGKLIDYAVKHELWIGAICAAPSILGHKGLLRGKKAVAYPGYEADLEGAVIGNSAVCEDGKLITANGPGASIAFGLKLVEKLKGNDTANQIAAVMQVKI